jgi:hypothetical protein
LNVPATRCAKSGALTIAYQELGSGPIDVVAVRGGVSNLEAIWRHPTYARFNELV